MPLNKYGTFPNGRINIFNHYILFDDVAILDFSTCGHGVYDYGNLSRLFYQRIDKSCYNANLNEIDLSLGQTEKAFSACEEIIKDKNIKHIFIMPSALSSNIRIRFKCLMLRYQRKI